MIEISYQVRIVVRDDFADTKEPTNLDIEDAIGAALRLQLDLDDVTVTSERLDK
jgi:hypothetical protein